LKFLILTALVFGIFAISLGVISADAIEYRFGTDFGLILIGAINDTFDFNSWSIPEVEPEDWKEGEKLLVTLIDQDENQDSTVQEKILFSNSLDTTIVDWPGVDPSVGLRMKQGAMPYIVIGDPTKITIDNFQYCYTNTDECIVFNYYWGTHHQALETKYFSDKNINSGDFILFNISDPIWNNSDLKYFINYDFESLNQHLDSGEISSFNVQMLIHDNPTQPQIINLIDSTNNFKNYIQIDSSVIDSISSGCYQAPCHQIKIIFDDVETNSKWHSDKILPLALDWFRFDGSTNSNTDWINAIFRLELEETGTDTGVFTGTITYVRISAANIDTFDFGSLETFGQDIVIPVRGDDSSRIRVNYDDRGADGVSTNIAFEQWFYPRAVVPTQYFEIDENSPIILAFETPDFVSASPLTYGSNEAVTCIENCSTDFEIYSIGSLDNRYQNVNGAWLLPTFDLHGTFLMKDKVWLDSNGAQSHSFDIEIKINPVNYPPTLNPHSNMHSNTDYRSQSFSSIV